MPYRSQARTEGFPGILSPLNSLGTVVQPALWHEGLSTLPEALIAVQAPEAGNHGLARRDLVACAVQSSLA